MNEEFLIVIIHFVFAFFICFGLTKWWISVAKKNKLHGKDMNKYNKPLIPEAGGLAVVISIVLTLMIYIFFKTFVLKTTFHLLEILILIITLLLACFIGFIDDILGWKKGIAGWKKILMTIPIAIPLMAINAGHYIIELPFFGIVNLGFFYPLLLIPIGVIAATNGFNLLAGHNGLEAGLGLVIFITLGIVSLVTGQMWLALIAGIIIFTLLAFLIFNKFPAKIFPGDSLTYSLGALIACFAILGNMEKIAILLFIPFIIEGILKSKSKFKAENFGKPDKNNILSPPYKKTYSLTHWMMKILKKRGIKATERKITNNLILIEIILAILILIFTL